MRLRPRRPHTPPEINLTPLIDVVFVILILFIVMAPLLEKEEITLAQAGHNAKSFHEEEPNSFSIEIHKDNKLLINQVALSIEQLPSVLYVIKTKHPDATPRVLCDEMAAFGHYQKVKLSLEEAGFERMELILKPHV